MVWAQDKVSAALAELELVGGNLTVAARNTGVPRKTLAGWRDEAAKVAGIAIENGRHDFEARWADAQDIVLTYVVQKAPEASFRDLSIFAGIAADKHLNYRDGRSGSIVVDQSTHNNTLIVEYADDWRG